MTGICTLRTRILTLLCLTGFLQGCLGNGWGYPGSAKSGSAPANGGSPYSDEAGVLPEGEYSTIARCSNLTNTFTLGLFAEKSTGAMSVIRNDADGPKLVSENFTVEKVEDHFSFESTELNFSILAPTSETRKQSKFYIYLSGKIVNSPDVEESVLVEDENLLCALSVEFVESFDAENQPE